MTLCPQCKAELPDDQDLACPRCGSPVGELTGATSLIGDVTLHPNDQHSPRSARPVVGRRVRAMLRKMVDLTRGTGEGTKAGGSADDSQDSEVSAARQTQPTFIEDTTPPGTLGPGASDAPASPAPPEARPGAPTLAVGANNDFTIAFEAEEAPILPADAHAATISLTQTLPAGTELPTPVTDSDLEFAFVEERPTNPLSAAQTLPAGELVPPLEDASSGERTATDSERTIALGDAAARPDPRTLKTHGIGDTMDVDELPPDQVEMLTGMWESNIPPDAGRG